MAKLPPRQWGRLWCVLKPISDNRVSLWGPTWDVQRPELRLKAFSSLVWGCPTLQECLLGSVPQFPLCRGFWLLQEMRFGCTVFWLSLQHQGRSAAPQPCSAPLCSTPCALLPPPALKCWLIPLLPRPAGNALSQLCCPGTALCPCWQSSVPFLTGLLELCASPSSREVISLFIRAHLL